MTPSFKNIFSALLISTSLMSCNSTIYKHNIREEDFLSKQTIPIHGELLDISAVGLTGIMAIDTFLVFTTGNPERYLELYSVNTMEHAASFCHKGRARNEFTMAPRFLSKQTYQRNNHIIIPLIDYSRLKELDLTESLSRQSTIITSNEECTSITDGFFVLLDNETDNVFEYNSTTPEEEDNTKNKTRFHLKHGNNTVDVPIYSGIMSGIGDEGFRSEFVVGSLYKHPQRNLVIQPLQYMDYILFFDFDKDSYFAVHQVGSMSFDEEITDDPYIHFSDCVCTDRWFLVDHLDESNVVSYLVFNWNGECIARLIPDVFPHRLTYDERSQTLYGVNIRTDSVYKFDLSGLLP